MDPCALGANVCDDGLRCVGGTCQPEGTAFEVCVDDMDCADGFQCIPWDSTSAGPNPDRCVNLPNMGDVTPANYKAQVNPDAILGILEEFITGVCWPLQEAGGTCDGTPHPTGGGCADCQAGLYCDPDTNTCEVPCSGSDVSPCPCNPTATLSCDTDDDSPSGRKCDICNSTNVPIPCTPGETAAQADCCDTNGASCNPIPTPMGGTQNVCCRPLGTACAGTGQCCVGLRCVGGTCSNCALPGETPDEGSSCCDGRDPEPDPLDPSDPTEYCLGDCGPGDTVRAGELCGPDCGHAAGSTLPAQRNIRVCSKNKYRCVAFDSPTATDAVAVGQIGMSDLPSAWPSTDTTCDVNDDDCDGDLNENFSEARCSNATVDGCGTMTFPGSNMCDNDANPPEVDCVAEPIVDYCKYGADADSDEWNGGTCKRGDGCCLGSPMPPMTTADGAECDFVVSGGEDLCAPSQECAADMSPASGPRWVCVLRDQDCAPTFCYDPTARNNEAMWASIGDACGDAPPMSMFGD